MKNEDIMKAMNDIEDRYIEEAEGDFAGRRNGSEATAPEGEGAVVRMKRPRRFRSSVWKIGIAAACFVGIFVLGYATESIRNSGNRISGPMANQSGDTFSGRAGDYVADSGAIEEAASEDSYASEAKSAGGADWGTAEAGGSSAGADSAASVDAENTDGTINTDKLVYTCNLTIQTKDYKASQQAIREKIKSVGGVVENETESDNSYNWYAERGNEDTGNLYWSVTIRIPTDQYEAFLNSVGDAGRVVSKSSYVDNISRNYHSTENRIQSLEKQLQKLQTMMDQATSINDMIIIESRISEVETELNDQKTWLSDMDTDVAYSTVYLDLEEVSAYSIGGGSLSFGQRIVEAVRGSCHLFVTGMETFLYGLIYALPFVVVIGLIVGIVKYIKKRKNKNTKVC